MLNQTNLNHRRPESQALSDSYHPKLNKPWTKPVDYVLREQRLIFVIVGMAIASVFFLLQPHLLNSQVQMEHSPRRSVASFQIQPIERQSGGGFYAGKLVSPGAKIPLGLKRKPLRVLVTGGAGFVGSHLVDRLIERGDSVIVVDNFFTGRKENVMHHFGNPQFELIRHDVVEPLLVEVDQIYHLACPASPVHYKHNPVKTIISFDLFASLFDFKICADP